LETKANYTIVGGVIVVLFGALLSAGLWLSVGFNQKEYSSYTVYLTESVAGLNEQSPVKYNGVQVGVVKKIQLNTNDPRQVELTLSIESSIPITTSTTATLISQGITGVTYVGLAAASSDLSPLQRMAGEPYPVIPAKPSLFNQLDTIIKEVAENVNKVSDQTQRFFNEENALYITRSLANLEEFTAVIAGNKGSINNSLKSADIFLANMATVSKDFPNILNELKTGVHRFNSLASDMSTASKNVTGAMVSGKNAANKISEETLPPAIILLRHLNTISANLEKVSNEMRQNPSVIVRGTKPPKPGPGE
jgi:phospholipid/cholesterol/gamma-HCH transport system substrate-binding protein